MTCRAEAYNRRRNRNAHAEPRATQRHRDDRPRRRHRPAARVRNHVDLRQSRLHRAAALPRLPQGLPLRARPAGSGRRRHGGRLRAGDAQRRLRQPAFRGRASGTRWATSSPRTATARRCVITAGQQARSILPFDPFLYSAQATELPKPYVKWSCEPARAEDVPLAIARALLHRDAAAARTRAGVDSGRRLGAALRARGGARREHRNSGPSPACWRRSARRSTQSSRPAFVVGAAVDRDGAWDDVVRLAERHHAAVWVAPMSGRCSFPEDHALFAGFLPPMREKIVDLLAPHDVIFALGAAAFTYHVEGAGPHLPAGARLVQLIDDPAHRRLDAAGHVGRRKHSPRRAGSPRAASRRGRAQQPGAAPRAAACRAVGADVGRRSSCRRWPRSAIRRRSSSRRRRARGARCRPTCRSCAVGNVLHDGQRRPRLGPAGRGGRGARQAGREGDRPHRRRLEHVLDPGAVERGAARAADHVHRAQEPALCGAARVRAGVRLRAGRAAARHRAAGHRFRGARARTGLSRREREPGGRICATCWSRRCGRRCRRSSKWTSRET